MSSFKKFKFLIDFITINKGAFMQKMEKQDKSNDDFLMEILRLAFITGVKSVQNPEIKESITRQGLETTATFYARTVLLDAKKRNVSMVA